MPQFDLANFIPQLAWLTLFFAILYFGIVQTTLPRVGRVVDNRDAQVRGDIARAEQAKAEADAVREAYQAALADARRSAQAALAEAQASSTLAIEKKLHAVDEAIHQRLAEADAALAAGRAAVADEMEKVAAAAAADIVAALGGKRPTEKAALTAVRNQG